MNATANPKAEEQRQMQYNFENNIFFDDLITTAYKILTLHVINICFIFKRVDSLTLQKDVL